MYITETTDNVRNLIEDLDKQTDLVKLKFLINLFERICNNHINDKDDINPGLNSDEDNLKILRLEDVGLIDNADIIFLH